jgi:putative PEP-CTERM system TPR-repeat lipoprotein
MNTLSPLNRTAAAVALALTLAGCGKTPEQHFENAQQSVQERDYRAAVIELKSVLQEQPDNRDARQLLGEVFFRSAAYPDAEKELSRARSLGAADEQVLPALAEIYVKLGEPRKTLDLEVPASGLSPDSLAKLHAMRAEALLALGNREEAERSLAAASQASPNQPSLLLTQAKLALVDRQQERAEQLVDSALEQDPTHTNALYIKGAFLSYDNKTDEATEVYRRILANDPNQFRAHLALANLHMKKGEINAADAAVRAAEKIAGKAPVVMHARGILELQRGNFDKASATLMEVLRAAPKHLPTMLAYAMASYGLGHYEQSINYAGRVLGALPDNLLATRILAGSQLQSGDVKSALGTLKSGLARHPDDAKLLAIAGEAHLRTGNYVQAMDYLDRAAKLDPENAAIRTRQAEGHLAAGDQDEALAELEAAAELSDKAGQADLSLVMLHLRSKDYDKALDAIVKLEKKLPDNPVTHNLRAAALIGKEDRAGARKALEKALAIEPRVYPAAANLARLDLADKKPKAARKRFESILAQDKGNMRAMMALAGLAAAEKNQKDQVAWLEKAAKADPRAIPPRAGLVQYHLAKKETQKALALAREAVAANPDSLPALGLLGTTQLATGDPGAATATFGRLMQKAPRSPEAHLHLALAQIAGKQAGPARDSLKTALQLKPDFLKAQDALMRLELSEKRPDAALQIARQIQTQQPGSPVGFEREAAVMLSEKRLPEAAKALDQALAKGAGAASLIRLHRVLSQTGNAQAADQRLVDWIKRHPEDTAARAYAAEAYMVANRNREAIAQYEALMKFNPGSSTVLNNLATLYQREKDARALVTAEQALKLAPDHPGVQDTLGWILLEQGELSRATALLAKAANRVPQSGTIRYHYGVALARGGKNAEAKKELQAAIAGGRKFAELEAAKALLASL